MPRRNCSTAGPASTATSTAWRSSTRKCSPASLPFEGRTTAQLAAQHLHSRPRLDRLPASDEAVIARALAKDPEQRFSSCREMIERLLDVDAQLAAPHGAAGAAEARTAYSRPNGWRPRWFRRRRFPPPARPPRSRAPT